MEKSVAEDSPQPFPVLVEQAVSYKVSGIVGNTGDCDCDFLFHPRNRKTPARVAEAEQLLYLRSLSLYSASIFFNRLRRRLLILVPDRPHKFDIRLFYSSLYCKPPQNGFVSNV